MSKTDKTRPLWVQIKDPAMRRHVTEFHNHEQGECTLEEFYGMLDKRAAWWFSWCHAWPSHGSFNKFYCRRGDYWRFQNERKRRVELRKTISEAMKTPIDEMDTVDFFYSTKTYY